MTFKTINLNRRHFALTALGGLTAITLAACGGGGDGDDASTVNLRAAFDKIQYKMTKDEVRAVVGRHEDDENGVSWTEGNQQLIVTFATNDQMVAGANRVRWFSGSTQLDRSLDLGE